MYANKIVDKARSYIGVQENPPGSNKVLFNSNYYGRAVSGAAYPWCAAFVWDIFRMCGASELFFDGKKTAYCPSIESWGKKKGLTVPKNTGQPGDIILFDFYNKKLSVHVGIIEAKNTDGSYTTIEGNTSLSSDDNGGAVMRRTRKQNVIRLIIRPKYKEEVKTVQIELNVLQEGAKGEQVKTLQRLLRMLGFKDQYGNTLVIDGSFGGKTDHALKDFQRDSKLEADGSCGPKTWEVILK